MLISVIIPVYNIEKYIERCVNSLITQNFPVDEYELILVNDGSTDGSLKILEQIAGKNPLKKIKILSKENGGLSSARNYGLQHGDGEYIWFVDGDDWVSEDSLKIIADELINFPDLEILEFDLVVATEYNTGFKYIYTQDKNAATELVESGKNFLQDHGYSLGVTVNIYKRHFLTESNFLFPVGKYSEDNIFSLETLLKAERFRKINQNLYFYYQREDSISHKKTDEHLKRYYDDIFSNLLKMREITANESAAVKKKINEMVAFFQLLLFLGLFKQQRFSLAKEYVQKMKKNKMWPIMSANRGFKFNLMRQFVNLFFNTTVI